MKEVSCGTCNMSDYHYLSSLSTESWLSLAFPQYAIEAQERNEASSSSSQRRVVGVLEGTFFCTSARMLLVLFVLCSFMAK